MSDRKQIRGPGLARGELSRAPRGGVSAAGFKQVKVISFGTGNKTLSCKNLVAGAASGDAFTVYVKSTNASESAWSQRDMATSVPPLYVDKLIDVEYRTAWDGSADVTGWWTRDAYTAYGC